MAVTHGHGNPSWTRDETILALALYFELGKVAPPEENSEVQSLSSILRSMPYHSQAARKESFRNPAGVAFKLQNLRTFETGKGLKNVSEMDRRIWEEFSGHPEEAKRLASLIRSGIESVDEMGDVEDFGEDEFYEGKLITLLHKKRERDPKLRRRLLESRYKAAALCCDLCFGGPTTPRAEFQDAMFEAHHLKPLSMRDGYITKIADVALLCANCHRLIHRAISIHRRWLTIAECKLLLSD
jgi:5-methylcytosine-specific restriction protein A